MPRVTFQQYLDQRAFLRVAWEEFDQLYSLLPAPQQWQLHRSYKPLANHTEEELSAYRAHVSEHEPSLPAQAGRLYAKVHRVYDTAIEKAKAHQQHPEPARARAATGRTRVGSGTRQITVRAVARPEPDLKKLSLALLEVARKMGEEQKHD